MNVTANPDRLWKCFRSFSYAKFTFTKLASWMTGVLAGASLGGPLLPAVAVIETAAGHGPAFRLGSRAANINVISSFQCYESHPLVDSGAGSPGSTPWWGKIPASRPLPR